MTVELLEAEVRAEKRPDESLGERRHARRFLATNGVHVGVEPCASSGTALKVTDAANRGRAKLASIAQLASFSSRRGFVWFALVGISVLWGTMGIATQVALGEGVAPYTLTTLRMTMASAILLVYLAGTRRRIHLSRHLLGDGFVMALGQVVLPSVLFAAALEHLPAGVASLLFALVPAGTAIGMRSRGAMGRRAGVGVAIALVGAVLVVFTSSQGDAGGSGPVVGAGLVGLAVLVTSFEVLYAKRHSSHELFEVMVPQLLIGTIVLLVPGIVGNAMDWRGLSLVTWLVVAYLAVGVTVVPTMVLWWLLQATTTMRVALVNYLFPVVAIVVGVLWFGEPLSGTLALAGIVLLAGVAIVESADGIERAGRPPLRPCPDLGFRFTANRV